MNTEDKIITFESYYDPMLAHIVRTRLEANGISCFIADENTLGITAFYNGAVGGVKLKIFERDLERCREILAADTNTYVVCPYCASTNVSNIAEDIEKGDWPVLNSIMNLANPFQTQMNWRCNNCQREFE